MGFIRGGLLFLIGFVLFTSLIVGNVFFTLALSITPENIQEQITSNLYDVTELVGEEVNLTEEIKENFGLAEEYCVNNSDFVFSQDGYTIDVSCDVVEQGPDALLEKGIKDIVDEFYYKDYSCESFWKCISNLNDPLFLFSEQTKDYLQNKFYFSLIVSLVLIGIMFFLVEQKTNLPLIVGSLLIVSSLPFMKLNAFASFFNDSFLQFLPVLLSKAYFVFLISFIAGVAVLMFGIGMKFFNLGGFVMEKLEERKKSQEMGNKVKKKK